ncbi:putative dna polymerase delta subunit [Phaeomoniella chlamydospora]|uniref:Putative dna polymerase delta subunit n=1 Tax=Phaeomoniella chlamydospora TaxID=158046 RepID=A0A0G2F469_PHACM|nr:putative dna polymerase delta subunit [Phaeomoniella chlamydospora]
MPLKPNILEDISKDHFISGPPPRHSYFSTDPNQTQTMLEDESGRLRLTGALLKSALLVTGVIVAVLGTENANGDFEVLETHVPDLPRQPQRWERDDSDAAQAGEMDIDHKDEPGKKIAIVSGLGISGNTADNLNLSLLSEWLLGEGLGSDDQESAARISRLLIAGNSLSDPYLALPANVPETGKKAASKKYGYDASSYNPAPTAHLDAFLAELLPSIPITLMAGQYDPANSTLPQQPIHQAMFPHARAYASAKIVHDESEIPEPGWFDSVTNPWEGDIEGWRFLGNSGQPVDDIFRYVEFGGEDGQGADGRLEVMESMLRWRCGAPTAPDTLWCYPFQDKDQFVVEECPHVYFVGNQPKFDSTVVEGPVGQQVRIISVPKFNDSGEVVLLDVATLEVELVKIEVQDLPE